MKRFFVFLLILALLPIFAVSVCPCASASSISQQSQIQKSPCHGCCKDKTLMKDCQAEISKGIQAVFFEIKQVIFTSLKALRPDSRQDIAINRRANVPAGDEPLFLSSSTPLYLSLQILRI